MLVSISNIHIETTVPVALRGSRLDQAAAQLFPDYSRSQLQQWIKGGQLTVNRRPAKTKDKLIGGEFLLLDAELEAQGDWQPEAIPLDIVYEDDALMVINKPAGLVVHPAAGNRDGTLLNALLAHLPELAKLPRAGIVHRLDKDTTGLMVVGKTPTAVTDLVAQLQARTVSRTYLALVIGGLTGGGTVDAPIDRHPGQRTKMAVVQGGKQAITHYRVKARFSNHTLLEVKLETGRTHQIRVHMAHLRHPLVGDSTYAGRFKIPPAASEPLIAALKRFPRQALHATALGLIHPVSGEAISWQVPLPKDMADLLALLRVEEAGGGE
ncbi:23S rRNA pseudouridine(1911/1915/1917) synthase RluD [Halioxenophilus sp. WMMB6]|uniref:23S rRNA pseudouridine(1911/1915/1917) synthase RluD n=1 Tax=Halioxenophilus sp. WMMB6 TaxID=3073815 RepID=UPI00398BBD39